MNLAPWAIAGAHVALILAAAKAHGRQVRLEREAHGHLHVDFHRDNHPWVEALWRRDRRTFWAFFAVVNAIGLSVAWLWTGWSGAFAVAAVRLVASVFALAFVVAGLASWARLGRDGAGAADWRRRARRGSIAWWLVVAAALLALVGVSRFTG